MSAGAPIVAASVALAAVVFVRAHRGARRGTVTWRPDPRRWVRAVRVLGWRRAMLWVGGAAGTLAVLRAAGELTVRRAAPAAVWGWGERPSLEAHDTFGWRLRPSSRTRLRWSGYDYAVRANALGFPGPNRPVERAPGMLRVAVTGDAFTSAEGVDTDAAWPRLLESRLRGRLPDRVVEVLSFAVPGYGPHQHAAVVREMGPRFRPDVIVVAMFVDDFDDARATDAAVRDAIGFGRPDPGRWWSVLALPHLADAVNSNVLQPLHASLTGLPASRGYHLGSFAAFERDRPELEEGKRLARARLHDIAEVARAVGARLVVLMAPAAGQVCTPDELPWWPRGLDLADAARFDGDRPQRWARELATAVGADYHDLRPVLAGGGCVYHPRNMHWSAEGHRRVAAAVAATLAPTGGMPR